MSNHEPRIITIRDDVNTIRRYPYITIGDIPYFMYTIGERIKIAREHLGILLNKKISQAELAELCGWINGQSRIGNYEKGIRTPSAIILKIIADATKTRVEWLQYESGDMTQVTPPSSIKEPACEPYNNSEEVTNGPSKESLEIAELLDDLPDEISKSFSDLIKNAYRKEKKAARK